MKYAWLLICVLLTACNVAKEEDKQAGQNLAGWTGKKVSLAIFALGRPDRLTKDPNGNLYTWNGKREVANTSITVGTGGQVSYSHSSDNTYISPCQLMIVTNKDGIILKSSLKGADLGCQQFSEEINDAENMHENFISLDGKPLQSALDVLKIPDAEMSRKDQMIYRWRNTKDGKTCLLRVVTDKDGIIHGVHTKGYKPACVKFSDELEPLATTKKAASDTRKTDPNP